MRANRSAVLARLLVALLVTVLGLAGGAARAERVTVFAAASLASALDGIAADWSAATGDTVVPVYGGSGTLAQQIRQGAPADLFVSADPVWMDSLSADGLIDAESRRDLLGNRLVLVGPAGARPLSGPVDPAAPWPVPRLDAANVSGIAAALDASGDGRLALGQLGAVPAGDYARAALEALGAWDGLEDRLLEAADVRAVARLVGLGEAPLGVVYATDATADPALAVVALFAADPGRPIVYPAASVVGAPVAARAFLDHLASPEAQARFAAQGFTALTP